MKRGVLFLSLALLSLPFVSEAQNRNEVTGAMLITTTDTIITHLPPPPPPVEKKPKTKAKAIELKKGYQQEVSVAYSFMAKWMSIHHINFNYIGGYRFNHHLFVGVGTGLNFGAGYNFKPYVIEDHFHIYRAPTSIIGWDDSSDYNLPFQKLSIPLYAHFKVYFMKTRLAPFLAFSGGVLFSAPKKLEVYENDGRSYSPKFGDYIRTEKYGAVTGMFEVMPGVNYQYSNNLGFNFQFGYATRSGHEWDRDLNENDYSIQRTWYHGFTMRLGVTF